MLRLIFVFGLIGVGAYYSLQGPFFGLLFYIWNAYFRPDAWVWGDLLLSLRLSLVIGAFVLMSAVPAFSRFRWSSQLVLVLLFFAQATVSLLASEHSELILDYWVEFMKVVIITVLITVLVDDERKYRLTLLVMALSLGFEGAKQGWAQFVTNPGATNMNSHAMLGDNNGVALGMMMLIPVFTALSQTAATQRERLVHRFFIAGVFYRAISTYSRGGFLAAGVVCLVSLWRAQHKVRTLLLAGILAAAVAAVMPQTFWDRMNTMTAPTEEQDSSVQGRLYFWGLAQEMAKDRPLTGVGLNGFRFAFERYDRQSRGEGGNRAVHSAWFGALSELGYPGLLLFAAVLVGALWSCQRIRVRAKREGRGNMVVYASHLQTSFVVFIVGATFLNGQYLELLWHFIGLTIALERIAATAPATVTVAAKKSEARPVVVTMPRYVPQSAPMRRER